MFQNLLKSMLPLSKYNVLKIKAIFGILNENNKSSATLCLPLSVCHSLSATLCLHLSVCHSLSATLCLPLSVCHSLSATLCLPLSVYHSLSTTLCLPLSLCSSLSATLCLHLCVFHSWVFPRATWWHALLQSSCLWPHLRWSCNYSASNTYYNQTGSTIRRTRTRKQNSKAELESREFLEL